MRFEYDARKNRLNEQKHGVSFKDAELAFADPHFVVIEDATHSVNEPRFFCFGKVDGEIMTVRFTLRGKTIRIFGAAYWRKGRKIYEEKNALRGQPFRKS